jgi:tetratricopeptide (TPR) repeat protein
LTFNIIGLINSKSSKPGNVKCYQDVAQIPFPALWAQTIKNRLSSASPRFIKKNILMTIQRVWATSCQDLTPPLTQLKIIFCIFICFLYFIGIFCIGKIYFADKYYNKGLNNEKNGKWLEAISLYEKAILLDPQNVDYYDRLSNLYILRARFPLYREKFLLKARGMILKGIKLCPKNGDLWLSLGMLSEIWGQGLTFDTLGLLNSESEMLGNIKCQDLTPQIFYKRALSLDPNNAFYHTVFANYYFKKGMEDEGMFEVRKALLCCKNINYIYSHLKTMKVDEKILNELKYL